MVGPFGEGDPKKGLGSGKRARKAEGNNAEERVTEEISSVHRTIV
jgi:hypothetical protein